MRKWKFLTQSSVTVLLNDSQTADELPTKIISFVGEAWDRRKHKWNNSLNSAKLRKSVIFIHSLSGLTVLMNDPQTDDEFPTKIITFLGEAGHRRNHEWSYSSESRRIVRKFILFTQLK